MTIKSTLNKIQLTEMGGIISIITGGGRGIGKAISERLAQDSAVLIVGRNRPDLEDTCAAIQQSGAKALFLTGDVSNPEVARAAVEMCRRDGFHIRNLICNAGIGKSGPTASFDLQTWNDIFAVNLTGSLHFIQSCLPEMVEQKAGTICFISSIAGVKGYAYTAAYNSSKHAQIGLARSLALEYGKHGISIVPICPSYVESEMTRRSISGVMNRRGVSEKEAEEVIKRTNPQRRIIPQAEVAEMVAFVCSGRVPSLSGNPLIMSGGE
jgi:NAD(P)-dependent dehydrogenase (short-subunit alcohol dehydrogenase family)